MRYMVQLIQVYRKLKSYQTQFLSLVMIGEPRMVSWCLLKCVVSPDQVNVISNKQHFQINLLKGETLETCDTQCDSQWGAVGSESGNNYCPKTLLNLHNPVGGGGG